VNYIACSYQNLMFITRTYIDVWVAAVKMTGVRLLTFVYSQLLIPHSALDS